MPFQLPRRLGRFASARSGLAALEFALLLPIMVLALFGSVELIDALDTNTRAQNAAASVADVTARDTEVTDEEVASLWAALDVLMFPESGADMGMRISCILVVDENTARVVWSEGHNMAARVADTTVALPAAMMTPGSSLIMAESEYPYDAPLGLLFPTSIVLKHEAYRRARLVDPIPRVA